MKLAVSEHFVIISPLSIEGVQARLHDVIGPVGVRMFPSFSAPKDKPYTGSVNGNEFQIRRILNYRNGFLPTITGTLEQRDNGTAIDVKMNLDSFTLLFLWLWVGMMSLGTCCTLASSLSSGNFPWISFVFPIFCFYAVAVTVAGFQYQVRNSKAFLSKLFEVEIP